MKCPECEKKGLDPIVFPVKLTHSLCLDNWEEIIHAYLYTCTNGHQFKEPTSPMQPDQPPVPQAPASES